ncbi:MAG: cation:proton antiporter [Aeromicrobium sp.]
MHPETPSEIAAVVLLDIAVIVVIARAMGLLFRRIGQPAVVAEIIAALILGPSLLGTLPGNPTDAIFPDVVRPHLAVIAALGLAIFMFIVGLELDLGLIRGKGRVAATISLSSIVLPFAMGATLAVWLHDAHDANGVELLPFALFIGAAMSVTAFPVLARILSERGIQRTRVGALALACAAVDDVLAWTMLAGVLAIVNASGADDLLLMLAESLAFVAVMFLVVKPQLQKLVVWRDASGRLTPNIFSIVLVGVLVCSFITDEIGIHAIFGAFLFGAIMPREGAAQLTHEILERVEQLTVLVLLPVFFIITGLQVDITDLGGSGLVELAAVLAVACLGKFLGAALAARACRIPTRRAAAVGILMNARGLTELVILSVGRSAGVLDDRLFTIMVLMAVITTVMTEPLLRLVYPDDVVAREVAQAERDALGVDAGYRVVAAVKGGDADADDTVDVAAALVAGETGGQLVISHLHSAGSTTEVGSGLTSQLAAVAASFESMQALSARAGRDDVAVVVRSQFSHDVVADLAAQVDAVSADVVVVDHSDPSRTESLLAASSATVVVVVPGPRDDPADRGSAALLEGSVRLVVVVGSGDDGTAAVEQTARMAAARSLPMDLLARDGRREARRADAVASRLAAGGIITGRLTSLELLPLAGTLPVVGWSDWRRDDDLRALLRSRPVVVVRSAAGDATERLTTWLADRDTPVRAGTPQPGEQV